MLKSNLAGHCYNSQNTQRYTLHALLLLLEYILKSIVHVSWAKIEGHLLKEITTQVSGTWEVDQYILNMSHRPAQPPEKRVLWWEAQWSLKSLATLAVWMSNEHVACVMMQVSCTLVVGQCNLNMSHRQIQPPEQNHLSNLTSRKRKF